MGMKHRVCARCGKERAFEEGTGIGSLGPACTDGQRYSELQNHVSRSWAVRSEGMVCCWCVKREAPSEAVPDVRKTKLGPKAWRKEQKANRTK